MKGRRRVKFSRIQLQKKNWEKAQNPRSLSNPQDHDRRRIRCLRKKEKI